MVSKRFRYDDWNALFSRQVIRLGFFVLSPVLNVLPTLVPPSKPRQAFIYVQIPVSLFAFVATGRSSPVFIAPEQEIRSRPVSHVERTPQRVNAPLVRVSLPRPSVRKGTN